MSDPFKVLNFLRECRIRHAGPDLAPSKQGGGLEAGTAVDVDLQRAAQVIDIKRPLTNKSIVARTLPAPTGHDVVTHATEVKVKELTAKYQPIVEKQVASLFPGIRQARQELVASVTQVLVDRDLATKAS